MTGNELYDLFQYHWARQRGEEEQVERLRRAVQAYNLGVRVREATMRMKPGSVIRTSGAVTTDTPSNALVATLRAEVDLLEKQNNELSTQLVANDNHKAGTAISVMESTIADLTWQNNHLSQKVASLKRAIACHVSDAVVERHEAGILLPIGLYAFLGGSALCHIGVAVLGVALAAVGAVWVGVAALKIVNSLRRTRA